MRNIFFSCGICIHLDPGEDVWPAWGPTFCFCGLVYFTCVCVGGEAIEGRVSGLVRADQLAADLKHSREELAVSRAEASAKSFH